MSSSPVEDLLAYAVDRGLIQSTDVAYARNRVLEVLRIQDYDLPDEPGRPTADVDDLLAPLLDDAVARGVLAADTTTCRDLLDTAIMGCLVPAPAHVVARFDADHAVDPVLATDAFHRMSVDGNYIRVGRTDRNIRWEQQTRYGPMTMTINVSKPEKDPHQIAAAASQGSDTYPRCLLCRENEGFAGNARQPARQNLRLVPVVLQDETWFLQYSPYAYFDEHCIVLSEHHRPMRIDANTFERLAQFTSWLPHYLVGSNADLPIVGGSILSHDHFQGGRYEFPIERARTLWSTTRDEVEVEVLDWPLAVLRVTGRDRAVIDFCRRVLDVWRTYEAPQRGVMSSTAGTPHNTITPIARRVPGGLRMDLILRNNRTDEVHPDGIFHPHEQVHVIKKENIGLIEAMGLAILPGRLAGDLDGVAMAYTTGTDLPGELTAYAPLLEELRLRGVVADEAKAREITHQLAGEYFVRGLEHCGVFSDDPVVGFQELLADI